VSLNVEGREPGGTVPARAIGAVRDEVEAALRALRDPWTGAPVVHEVWPRERLYDGPFVERAPDLLLELHLDRGASYNLMPSAGAPPGTGPWRKLAPSEHLGRKGRSLPGSHRPRGFFAMAGPRVRPVGEIDARIADATVTLLARLDVRASEEMSGRVLREALHRARASGPTLSAVEAQRRSSEDGDATKLERRLRALGYID
jgi:predicted AlkP superfamily phosphohydrolase/phosphomutase